MWESIQKHITQTTGQAFTVKTHRSVVGGCINQAWRITGADHSFFVKRNDSSKVSMFEAEAFGLLEIEAAQAIRVPHPICWGTDSAGAYLVLEWIDFNRNQNWTALGQKLAALHQVSHSLRFGWVRENTIGSTPQINTWHQDWPTFFAECRLQAQIERAQKKGCYSKGFVILLDAIPEFFKDYQPQSSLVHGDLWSGNIASIASGEPIIFDPAVYFGDREVDIAMTELFGGFPGEFYRAYDQTFPLDKGYTKRKNLYNLYHVLNHFNLFGGGYASQAERMIQQLLRSI
jgi:fructosamine-3-kinase